jgi:hypothetical protein
MKAGKQSQKNIQPKEVSGARYNKTIPWSCVPPGMCFETVNLFWAVYWKGLVQ